MDVNAIKANLKGLQKVVFYVFYVLTGILRKGNVSRPQTKRKFYCHEKLNYEWYVVFVWIFKTRHGILKGLRSNTK